MAKKNTGKSTTPKKPIQGQEPDKSVDPVPDQIKSVPSDHEVAQKMFEEKHKLYMSEFQQLMEKHKIKIAFAYVWDEELKSPIIFEKGHPADLAQASTRTQKYFKSFLAEWLNR
jgi:hypothetical protein